MEREIALNDAAPLLAALLDIPPEHRMNALAAAAKAYVEIAELRVFSAPRTPEGTNDE